jgi:DNA-binding protein H-NS
MATKLDELQQKIDALQKERDQVLASERSDAIEKANALIKTYSLKLRDLSFKTRGYARSSGPRAPVAMKYKSGDQAWSGRGRKPKWVEAHLSKGGKLTDLAIKKP